CSSGSDMRWDPLWKHPGGRPVSRTARPCAAEGTAFGVRGGGPAGGFVGFGVGRGAGSPARLEGCRCVGAGWGAEGLWNGAGRAVGGGAGGEGAAAGRAGKGKRGGGKDLLAARSYPRHNARAFCTATNPRLLLAFGGPLGRKGRWARLCPRKGEPMAAPATV